MFVQGALPAKALKMMRMQFKLQKCSICTPPVISLDRHTLSKPFNFGKFSICTPPPVVSLARQGFLMAEVALDRKRLGTTVLRGLGGEY